MAHANVGENPKTTDSAAVVESPNTMTKRQPYRLETRPQKREETKKPAMIAV